MELRKIVPQNNRGSLTSFIFVITSLFAIAVFLLFINFIFDTTYTKFSEALEDNYNNSQALESLRESQNATNSAWDYVFFGLFMGYLLLLGLTAFTTRINAVFFFIYVLISLTGFIVGIMLSNVWSSLVENPTLAETLARFPITNFILGTYYPTIMTLILAFFLVILFGKPGGSEFE